MPHAAGRQVEAADPATRPASQQHAPPQQGDFENRALAARLHMRPRCCPRAAKWPCTSRRAIVYQRHSLAAAMHPAPPLAATMHPAPRRCRPAWRWRLAATRPSHACRCWHRVTVVEDVDREDRENAAVLLAHHIDFNRVAGHMPSSLTSGMCVMPPLLVRCTLSAACDNVPLRLLRLFCSDNAATASDVCWSPTSSAIRWPLRWLGSIPAVAAAASAVPAKIANGAPAQADGTTAAKGLTRPPMRDEAVWRPRAMLRISVA